MVLASQWHPDARAAWLDHLASNLDCDNGPFGCWIWTGSIDPSGGFGTLRDQWNATDEDRAHRAVWATLVRPLEPDVLLYHRCYRKLCCNPLHLECIDIAENGRRRSMSHSECHVDGVPKHLVGRPWRVRFKDACNREKLLALMD